MSNQQAAVRDFETALATVAAVSAADTTAVAGSMVAGGTGATAGGWDSAEHRDTSITTMTECKTVINTCVTLGNANKVAINTLITELRAKGLLA